MTRFQRLHLTIGLSALAVLLCMASARSQTFEEAVRANLSLATALCFQHVFNDTVPSASALQAAGFAPVATEPPGSGRMDRFVAPADTVSVQVNSFSCEIDSRFIAAREAVQLVMGVLAQVAPGSFRADRNSYNACQGLYGQRGNLPINIYVGSLDPVPGRSCVENGTSRIWFEIPG